MVDVCVIGAGPCGISCAITAIEKGLSVSLVECGNRYDQRKCSVDQGNECLGCNPCNVISGFGGCVHYGDSAKLSYYPSGRALHRKFPDDYERLLEKALSFWHVGKNEFVNNYISSDGEPFEIKRFPVREMKSTEIKQVIEEAWRKVEDYGVDYYRAEMVNYTENDRVINVDLSNGKMIECRNLVLATGRKGIDWFENNSANKLFETRTPIPSLGVRFEMPKEYLAPLGKIHPDFKFRMEYKGYKYKTFCFCGGKNGGRVKYANYGSYTLLDGHVLTETDKDSSYGNFALLRQLIKKGDDVSKVCEIKKRVLNEYVAGSNGRPIYQSYESFKECKDYNSSESISVKCAPVGSVYRFLESDIEDYCTVAEKVFSVISKYASCSVDEIIRNTKVIGIEMEGLWNGIDTDEWFKVKGRNIYIGGDCAGENQGIIQATIAGIRIAEGVTTK